MVILHVGSRARDKIYGSFQKPPAMWNYQDPQQQHPWMQMPANFAVFPAPTNVPMTPLGMGTAAQPMQPMTVPAVQQMPPIATPTPFDPWTAAAVSARTQTASYVTTGTEGGRMEPPDAALWRNYQAPTTQFPDQQQQQQQQQTGAQYAPDASSGPSHGTDQRGTQADPAQTTTTGPQWRPSVIPPSNAGGLTPNQTFTGPGATDAQKSVTGITASFLLTQIRGNIEDRQARVQQYG